MRPAATLLLFAIVSTALADTTRRYEVLFEGKRGGSQTTTVRKDGRIAVDFTYRYNGRGPDLHEEIAFGADGALLYYRVTGKSTYGAPVDESYRRTGNRAVWRASADRGEITLSGPAVYVPVESSLEPLAVIACAAARQTGGMLAAVPGGEVRVEKLLQTTLDAGGTPLPVALYSVSGIDVSPGFIWLTDEASMRLAAYIYPGFMQVVDDAIETHAAELEKLQVQAESDLQKTLQDRLAHRFAEPIVFRNVRVFDSAAALLTDPADVFVNRGRIAAIYPAGAPLRDAGTIIDGAGRVLMPALFDMHTHASAWDGPLQIAAGVTVARDMGNNNESLAGIKSRIDSDAIVGPTIVPAGFIEGESPYSARGGFVVSDLQGAKDAVDWYAERGYYQIKIYNSFHPEWVHGTAAYAHARGLRVSGHIPAFMKADDAVRAGYDEIQHINQVLLNFYVTPTTDTRTLARFYLIADNVHALDLDSDPVRNLIRLLKEHGTTIDLTLATFESSFTQLQGEPNPTFGMVADHVPVNLQRVWRTNSMNATKKNIANWRASYAKMLEFSGRLFQAGVPLVAGTDEIAGFTLHRELELYVKAGIAPAEVLKIATWNGAKYTGTLANRGSVERGKIADLILVDGDPTTHISDIRRINLVMKGGTIYYPAEVYQAIGVKGFVGPPTVGPAK
jgi:hypothetical protein